MSCFPWLCWKFRFCGTLYILKNRAGSILDVGDEQYFAFVPGKDWAFTYGPLGFMFVPQMVGNNVFWANLLNNFLPVSLLIGGVGYLIFRQYRLDGKVRFPGFRLAGILVAVLSFALSLGIGIFCSVCVFAVFNR